VLGRQLSPSESLLEDTDKFIVLLLGFAHWPCRQINVFQVLMWALASQTSLRITAQPGSDELAKDSLLNDIYSTGNVTKRRLIESFAYAEIYITMLHDPNMSGQCLLNSPRTVVKFAVAVP
jgi:hypothetical protein